MPQMGDLGLQGILVIMDTSHIIEKLPVQSERSHCTQAYQKSTTYYEIY